MTGNILVAAAVLSLFALAPANASGAFVCPVPSPGANAAESKAIVAATPAGDALADAGTLNAAVAALRAKGIGNAVIVDSLISAYCPLVARNNALNDEQKRAQVRRFAARMVRLVYVLDSAEAVILDVPFRPDVLEAINARAAAERISPEAWVANAVERDLKRAR